MSIKQCVQVSDNHTLYRRRIICEKGIDLDILQDKFCTDERGAEMKLGDGVDFVAKFWIMYK